MTLPMLFLGMLIGTYVIGWLRVLFDYVYFRLKGMTCLSVSGIFIRWEKLYTTSHPQGKMVFSVSSRLNQIYPTIVMYKRPERERKVDLFYFSFCLVSSIGLIDHVQHKNIDISDIYTLVLDEADKMLDMGFIKDIRKIMKLTPSDKQIAMFSATMSREVMNITWEYMDGADEIEVAPKEEDMPKISQYILHLEEREKMDAFAKIMEKYDCSRVMAFCNTKTRVRVVTEGIKRDRLRRDCSASEYQGQ